MPEYLRPPARQRPRRWFQFSVRTLLLLTAAAAAACAWWLRPAPRETLLADGVLILQERIRGSGEADESPGYVRWQLATSEGQRLVRGGFRDDRPHGRWSCYYADGRAAVEGACILGEPISTWRSWSPDGKSLSKTRCEPTDRTSGSTGTVRSWWPNGQLRMEGTLRNGREHGWWTVCDLGGQPTASGPFRQGRRHAWWTFTDSKSGISSETVYAHDLPLPDIQDQLACLTATLRSGDLADRISAARALERLGPIGAGALIGVLKQADQSTEVVVLQVLGCMGEDATCSLPEIQQRLDAESPLIRLHAALAGMLIDSEHRSRYRGGLRSAVGQAEFGVAMDAMLRICEIDAESRPELLRYIFDLLDRGDGRERVLVELGAKPAMVLPLLEQGLADPDTVVRARVLELLVACRRTWSMLLMSGEGHRGTLARLILRASEDPNPQVRRRARELLDTAPPPPGPGGIF